LSTTIKQTLISLLIGGFFIWLSAGEWPLDRLAGSPTLDNGHLVVGDASVAELTGSVSPDLSERSGWAMSLGWLGIYLLILSLIHVLRVIRWKPLLDPIVELDWKTHNRIGAVGFMAMFLFPLRLGELVRPYLVKQQTAGEAKMRQVLATVVVERVADGLMVSLLLVGVLTFLPNTSAETQQYMLIGAGASLAIFVGTSLFLVIAAWQTKRALWLIDITFGVLSKGLASKLKGLVQGFLYGLRATPDRKGLLFFALLTVVYWLLNGVGVWSMVKAFYLPVDLVGAYAMMACVVCGMMIPNSPGNVGSFWYFLLVPASLYGIAAGSVQAIAFGIMVWFLQLIQQTAFGAYFILTGKVSMARVLAATQENEESLTQK